MEPIKKAKKVKNVRFLLETSEERKDRRKRQHTIGVPTNRIEEK